MRAASGCSIRVAAFAVAAFAVAAFAVAAFAVAAFAVAASGWQRLGGSLQVRDTAAALRAEAPPGVDSCR